MDKFGLPALNDSDPKDAQLDLTPVDEQIPSGVSDFSVVVSKSGTEAEGTEGALFKKLMALLVYLESPDKTRIEWLKEADAVCHSSGSSDAELIVLVRGVDLPCRVNAACCHNQAAIRLCLRITDKTKKTPGGGMSFTRSALNPNDEYPIQSQHIAKTFWDQLCPVDKDSEVRKSAQGLIVIAGSTNSGKSELMKPIVNEYLGTVEKAKDRELLHLLTAEEPIEKWFSDSENAESLRTKGVTYTPRALGRDVTNLKQALRDAKRQTPACFVVGELRAEEDWREVINFATTGHLIVVTTHASSVRETLLKIFKALGVSRSQERRQVANALLAVVHARLLPIPYTADSDVKAALAGGFIGGLELAQIPVCWLGKTSAVNQLTVDGLSSVFPNGEWCLSRTQFLQKMKDADRIPKVAIKLKKEKEEKSVEISADYSFTYLHAASQKQDINELRQP